MLRSMFEGQGSIGNLHIEIYLAIPSDSPLVPVCLLCSAHFCFLTDLSPVGVRGSGRFRLARNG